MLWYEAIKRLLNRPGGRSILGALISANYWWLHRSPLSVRWHKDGYWLMHYADAVIPLHNPDASHYRDKEAVAIEAYFHLYQPKAGDVVVHVGAGAGWEANLLSRLVGPDGHVFLIEAHPKTYLWLKRRIDASHLINVTPIKVAISDRSELLHITDDVDHMLNQINAPGGIEVQAKSLEEILTEYHVDRVDFLSMNIEGAERQGVRGIGSAASKIHRLAISCHDFLADRGGDGWTRTKAEVDQMLRSYGYAVSYRNPCDQRDWTRDYLYASRG
ncbi:FkbM family methyltransferase [Ferribacterium limneticum]|uniref:FkbM family methyltransferase n=1 Tax=Ferribacterium limneticum TaxID=76259 RepID=UPI001CFB24F1|nr:FkbM family methyltransferase [Ferribacterium limneticum]UCV17315.1 FkbM family methyltransferase [Ferribacterium limneticum]